MSGGFATRGPGPSYAPGYGGAQSRVDAPEPATPAQRDADQAYAEEVRAAQLLQDARDLAGASPHEWATRRDELARRVEALASTRTSPAFASPEGDASRQRTAAALVEARRILGSARQPRAVPAVAGEEAIDGRISDKSAAPDEVIAWLTRLSLDERKVVLRRYEAVSGGGHKNSPDRFAVDLANYFAVHRGLARELHRLAMQSQKQAAMARAQQAERDAAAAAEALPVAAPIGLEVTAGPAREQSTASSKYLGEHWQELRLAVSAEFTAKVRRWIDPRLAWGIAPDAVATIAIDGLLPTMYMPGTLENLVESLDDLVSNARAVGRQPGERDDAWNPAVGRAIGRDLEDDLGRAARTMSANYARATAGRRGRSPHDVLHPTTRYEQLAVDLLERGKVHLVAHPAAKPAAVPTPTPAEREAVLGPAVEVGPAPDGQLTFEPASPIPTDVDAHEAQRATLRNAGAAQGYAAAGGAGGALAIDTASERFDQLDGSDPTRADLDARIDTFLLKLGTLSQNLDRTATSLFAGRATIGHFAGLGVVGTAEAIADRAQAVNAFVSRERKALADRLSGVSDPGARQRLLAAAQHRIAASISQTQLVELSEQAVKALRDIEEVAQWTSVVMTLVISIAASFVAAEIGAAISSSLLAALARTTMAGASLAAAEGGALVAAEGAALAAEGGAVAAAEGAAATAGATGGAKAVALLAGQLTEAAINAAFQSSVFGDDSSTAFAENLLTSLLAHGVSGGVGRVNKALERAGETGGAVKVGVGALEISAGAGAGFGSQAIVRGGDAPSGADFAIQGVSIVFAHWLGRRIAKAKERLATSDAANATELQAQLDDLMQQRDRLVAAGTAVDRAELVRLVATSREVLGAAEHPSGAAPARRAKAAEPPEARGGGRDRVQRGGGEDSGNVDAGEGLEVIEPKARDVAKPTVAAENAERAGHLEALAAALPSDLRGRVSVIASPEPTGTTVRVTYRDGVSLVVGPDATLRHLVYHFETARALLRYEGFTGRIRRLLDQVLNMLGIRPGYGTAGFEAQLEVRKLAAIRDDLQRLLGQSEERLKAQALEPGQLEAELRTVEAQLAVHERQVGSFLDGAGSVEARGLPEHVVPVGAVQMEEIEQRRTIVLEFTARMADGQAHSWATAEIPLDEHGNPESGPEFYIDATMRRGGADVRLAFVDGEVPVPLTQLALERASQYYRRRFGVEPSTLPGHLAMENKLNFQREWFRLTSEGASEDEAKRGAAARTSFGRHRIARGYSDLSVEFEGVPESVDIGPPYGVQLVPTGIKVTARKTSP